MYLQISQRLNKFKYKK